jgi:predicted nucleotidyltransferase
MGNKEIVLSIFLDHPTQGYSLRELERRLALGLPSVIRYVAELRKEGLVIGKRFGNSELLYANRDDAIFRRRKVFRTIENIYGSGLIDLINEECSYPAIVLFGSKSRGEDVEGSDTDLFIQAPERTLNLERFEKRLGSVHLFMRQNVCDVPNKHLAANIINGIVLEGYLDLEAMLGRVPRARGATGHGKGKVAQGDGGSAPLLGKKVPKRR